MRKAENIIDFISSISRGECVASAPIIEHIGIIIRQWCRKNKYEINWVAFDGTVCDESKIYIRIYEELIDKIIRKNIHVKTFDDYKSYILEIAAGVLRSGLTDFNNLLINGDNKAWKKLHEVLQVYAHIWLLNRNLFLFTQNDDLHYLSLNTLFEKISGKKLNFANSYELKSYYFRILENKSKEEQRVLLRGQRFTNTIPDIYDEEPTDKNDDIIHCIKKHIEKLGRVEKHILLAYFMQEKKLAEIASELDITPENCRVIKHRAMKRLIQVLPR